MSVLNEVVFVLHVALSPADVHVASANSVYTYRDFHECVWAEHSTNAVMPDLFWFCKRKELPALTKNVVN